jgi:hypothetical protein
VPIDGRLAAADAFPAHAAIEIQCLGYAYQDLFRVAAAQGAGAAERQMVNNRNTPPFSAAAKGRSRRCSASADDNEVILLSHEPARRLLVAYNGAACVIRSPRPLRCPLRRAGLALSL